MGVLCASNVIGNCGWTDKELLMPPKVEDLDGHY